MISTLRARSARSAGIALAAALAAAACWFAPLPGAGGSRAPADAGVADRYKVDPVHSVVIFKISHDNAGTFFGRFNKVAGVFELSGENPSSSTLEFTLDAESVDTANDARDKHLRSADFFNAKQYAAATFKSTAVRKTGEGAFEATGDLTLLGVTRPVTVAITSARTATSSNGRKPIAGFEATFTVKRSDFGMTKYAASLGDEVTVFAGIEGGR